MSIKLKNTFKSDLQGMGLCDEGCTWVGEKDFATAYSECNEPEWLMRVFKSMAGRKGWPTRAEITAVNIRIAERIINSSSGKYVGQVIEEYTGVDLAEVVHIYNLYSSHLIPYATFLKARKSAKLAFTMISEPICEAYAACVYYSCYPVEHTAAASTAAYKLFKPEICDIIKSTFPVKSLTFQSTL